MLRLPQRHEDLRVAEQLLERDVIVQDGDLYGFSEHGRVVVSLLTPLELFRAGVERVAEFARF